MRFIVLFLIFSFIPPVLAGTFDRKELVYQKVTITFYNDKTDVASFEAEIANTVALRETGLMNREKLDKDKGMLFVFPDSEVRFFWMKNTAIPLDIIYINAKKKVVHIVKEARPYDLTLLSSRLPAKYALEINGGLSDRLGLEAGQKIRIE